MLRFALFSPPDEGPPLFKDHHHVNHRVVSQEGDYCNGYSVEYPFFFVFLMEDREYCLLRVK